MIIGSIGSTFPSGSSGSTTEQQSAPSGSTTSSSSNETSGSTQTSGTSAGSTSTDSGSTSTSSGGSSSGGASSGSTSTGSSSTPSSAASANASQRGAVAPAGNAFAAAEDPVSAPPQTETQLREAAISAQKRLNLDMMIRSLGTAPATASSLLGNTGEDQGTPLAVSAYAENLGPTSDQEKSAAWRRS